MRFILAKVKKFEIWGGNFPDPEVVDPTQATKKLPNLGKKIGLIFGIFWGNFPDLEMVDRPDPNRAYFLT